MFRLCPGYDDWTTLSGKSCELRLCVAQAKDKLKGWSCCTSAARVETETSRKRESEREKREKREERERESGKEGGREGGREGGSAREAPRTSQRSNQRVKEHDERLKHKNGLR